MTYHPYIIRVSGNLVAEEGKNYIQSLAASSSLDPNAHLSPGVYDDDHHAIIGDLIFDKKKRAVPYAMYVAQGAVKVQGGSQFGAGLACTPGFFPAFAYFADYISEIRAGLEAHVHEDVIDLYYNGLYISAFSVLELFLCDFLLCGVFSNEVYYQNALMVLGIKVDSDQYRIEKAIKDTVFSEVFHRFERIERIFMSVFCFGFPDHKELGCFIYRRHNIVHRYALSNLERMTVCNASFNDVSSLIEAIVRFVEEVKNICGLNQGEKQYLIF